MILHTLDTELLVTQTCDQVFPFFCDAFNLERITPPELKFRILTPRPIDMCEGTLIDYRLRLWGIPFRWRTRIRCWRPPTGFVDEQVSGPFRRWVHRHDFVSTEAGTRVIDHVDYALPLTPLSELAYPLVRRQLARIFRYRHAVLHEVFRAGPHGQAPVEFDRPVPVGP
jgi:ligand-binding SRPBCC domain-containing protein